MSRIEWWRCWSRTHGIEGPHGHETRHQTQTVKLTIGHFSRLERQDSEVSPGTVLPKPTPANARGDIAPWEDESPSADQNVPQINREPPTARPSMSSYFNNDARPTQMPQSIFGGSYFNNDSNDNLGQVSPGYAPAGGMGFPGDGEDRRPSIASATTVSSTGSKNSIGGRVHKKLQGFFGEDVSGVVSSSEGRSSSRQNSETSSMQNGQLPPFAPGGASVRNRNNSMNDQILRSGPPSPSNSRPRTPQPSHEVTPWVFQDPEVG